MKILTPSNSQLSTFLNSNDLINRFINLFAVARNEQQKSLKNIKVVPVDGGSYDVIESGQSLWLEFSPTSVITGGFTVTLPNVDNLIDGQEVFLTTVYTINPILLLSPGAAFNMGFTSLAANAAGVRFKFSKASGIWYRM